MKKKNETQKKILMIVLTILMLSSGFLVFTPKAKSSIKVNVTIYFDPVRTYKSEIEIEKNSNALNALNLYLNLLLENQYITTKTVSLINGRLNCIMNYCKTNDKQWNFYLNGVLINESLETTILKENDDISFKYEFINKTI
jgi:hypothetical protein